VKGGWKSNDDVKTNKHRKRRSYEALNQLIKLRKKPERAAGSGQLTAAMNVNKPGGEVIEKGR